MCESRRRKYTKNNKGNIRLEEGWVKKKTGAYFTHLLTLGIYGFMHKLSKLWTVYDISGKIVMSCGQI